MQINSYIKVFFLGKALNTMKYFFQPWSKDCQVVKSNVNDLIVLIANLLSLFSFFQSQELVPYVAPIFESLSNYCIFFYSLSCWLRT
jgi:hypothetical protein